jgi:uncharacterized membrane protein YciS (DUF1049 family)
MIRKLLAAIILIPLAVALVALALANRHAVTISFDPFNPADPAFVLQPPLFVLVFALLIAGVVIGGVAAWMKQGRWRRRARRIKAQLDRAEREIADLKARAAQAAAASEAAADAGAAAARSDGNGERRPTPQWPPPRALPPAA